MCEFGLHKRIGMSLMENEVYFSFIAALSKVVRIEKLAFQRRQRETSILRKICSLESTTSHVGVNAG